VGTDYLSRGFFFIRSAGVIPDRVSREHLIKVFGRLYGKLPQPAAGDSIRGLLGVGFSFRH
jgi:hypothetical protein